MADNTPDNNQVTPDNSVIDVECIAENNECMADSGQDNNECMADSGQDNNECMADSGQDNNECMADSGQDNNECMADNCVDNETTDSETGKNLKKYYIEKLEEKYKIGHDTVYKRMKYLNFHQVLAQHIQQPVQDILDLGCSVGISTLALHRFYQSKVVRVHTVGLDLSPYMLSVAKHRDTNSEISQWVHANAEATNLSDSAFDLVTLQFVIHELPRQATIAVFQEALRLLRPGGHLAIVDNNPQSPVIQNLPPILFTLMKSTEPWSDDYYTFNVEGAMQSVGFQVLATVASDPRHRTILARKS